jgi:hypothetical protein
VLPHLTEDRVAPTPLGPPSLTVAMLRVTWHIVGVFAMTVGAVLVALAWSSAGDPAQVVVRLFAVMWFTAAAMAWLVSPNPMRNLLRLPVPVVWVVVAVLCAWAG